MVQERFGQRIRAQETGFAYVGKRWGATGYSVVILSDRWEQAEASYARMLTQCAKTPFESSDAERRLRALVRDQGISELKTKSQRLFFVRRSITDTGVTYEVFRTEMSAITGEEPIGFCEIGNFANGICVIANAEVARSFQRKGIATAVYDLITSDMAKAGGLMWPASPKKMSDADFKVWWRRSPALVFYYPHRDRLGLKARPEFEELFRDTMNRGIWDKSLAYCSQLLSRLRSLGVGRSRP
jgi:ribosomal protein S18 acetylase RimI-like enzyme